MFRTGRFVARLLRYKQYSRVSTFHVVRQHLSLVADFSFTIIRPRSFASGSHFCSCKVDRIRNKAFCQKRILRKVLKFSCSPIKLIRRAYVRLHTPTVQTGESLVKCLNFLEFLVLAAKRVSNKCNLFANLLKTWHLKKTQIFFCYV